jgi:hypothetical protein
MCCFTEPPQSALCGVTIETKIFDYGRIVGWSHYACVVGLFKGTMKVYGDTAGSCDTVLAALVARATEILASKIGEFSLRGSIVREFDCA